MCGVSERRWSGCEQLLPRLREAQELREVLQRHEVPARHRHLSTAKNLTEGSATQIRNRGKREESDMKRKAEKKGTRKCSPMMVIYSKFESNRFKIYDSMRGSFLMVESIHQMRNIERK